MATTTIVQYLNHTGKSVTTGASVELGVTPLDRKQEETFLTETAVVKGQLVAIDNVAAKMTADPSGGFSALVVVACAYGIATRRCVVGVAAESVTGTATSPQPVRVVVRGPATLVPFVAATAIGDALQIDTAGGVGTAMVSAAGTFSHVLGYAMSSTAGAGTGTVYVLGCGI